MKLKLSLALVTLLVAGSAMATSFIVPTDDEMVAKSSAILTGTVEGSWVREDHNTIDTIYEIRVERVIKGAAKASELVQIVSPGGIVDDQRGLFVPAAARFAQGEHVLLFLTEDVRGELRPTDLTLGRFKFVTSTAGEKLLVRAMEDVVGWDHSGRVHHEPVRKEEGFLNFVEQKARRRNVDVSTDYFVDAADVVLQSNVTTDAVQTNAAPFPADTYTDYVNNQPVRWPNMSAGVTFYKRSDQNISGASDGGVAAIQNGLAAWTNECGSLINLIYGGQRATASANHDGVNMVEYNDPQSRISGSWTGSGTVAVTFLSFAGSHTFLSKSWLNITDADVVFQNGFPATSSAFAPAMTHELGHGIGWRHSNQSHLDGGACNSATEECTSAAIMNSSVNGNYGYTLQPWDINAAQSVYPGGTCGGTCTVPVIGTEPTSRTIASGASTTLTVSATGTAPLSYQWYIGTSGTTTSPISGATSSSLTVSPTSTVSYWVRVSNSCGSDNSVTATVTVTTSNPTPVVNRTRADFDGDGRSEIIWRNTSNSLAMWDLTGRTLNNGAVFQTISASSWRIEGYGDFTGDGKYDILLRNTSSNAVAMWVMNGRTRVSGDVIATLSDSGWNFQAFGDFTGDGRMDAIVRHNSTGQVALWEFTSTGALANGGIVQTLSDANWRVQGTGDFNGDQKDEVLWRNTATNQLAMWEFTGRTLTNGGVFATVSSSDWVVQGVGDFNKDGKDDIVWRNSSNTIAMWDMNGRTIVNGNVVATVSSSAWAIDAIGDFDGDGDDEIIFYNATSRDVAMWEFSNHTLTNGGIFASVSTGWTVQPPFDPVR
jgi:hypothetical protein